MMVCHPLISTANPLSLGDAQGQGTSGGKIRGVLPDAHFQGSSAGSSWGLGRWLPTLSLPLRFVLTRAAGKPQ